VRCLAFILSLLYSALTWCQLPLFTRITEKDGLVFREIHDLCFDKQGALWIGTAMGLNRFDGDRFTTFTASDGLPAPRVFEIESDSTGALWFGTARGLARRDPVTGHMQAWTLGWPCGRCGERGQLPAADAQWQSAVRYAHGYLPLRSR
jgi:hypothetical protein